MARKKKKREQKQKQPKLSTICWQTYPLQNTKTNKQKATSTPDLGKQTKIMSQNVGKSNTKTPEKNMRISFNLYTSPGGYHMMPCDIANKLNINI